MKLVLIGGHSRNIGKTSVAAGLIRALPGYGWVAVKITQFGHGICSIHGEHCGCSPGEHSFAITEEHELGTGTDTSRFLDAGARRSIWVRTKQGELFTALPSLQKEIETAEFVMVESNSLRRFLKPAVYLQVLDPQIADFKVSARQFFDLADAYLFVAPSPRDSRIPLQDPWINVSLSRELARGKASFPIRPEEGFLSAAVVAFVREKLEGPGSSSL